MGIRDQILDLFRFKQESSSAVEMLPHASLSVANFAVEETESGANITVSSEEASAYIQLWGATEVGMTMHCTTGHFGDIAFYKDGTYMGSIGYDATGNGLYLYSDTEGDVLRANLTSGRVELNSAPPANASAAGASGSVTWDANYWYVCVSSNTWKRTALSTW